MPRLSDIDGVAIWINTRDHLPPHFHARCYGSEIRIEIAMLSVLTGSLPAPK